jgi:hypothetical protein
MNVRRMGLKGIYRSIYPVLDADHVKATTNNATAYTTCDPSLSVVGANVQWGTTVGVSTNQRFHIDLGHVEIIKRIYYENYHASGLYADTYDAKNFTLWGSNNAAAFAELTYATDTNWTQLTTSQSSFDCHVAANQADPKYITVTNTTPYRYYAFKIADTWYGAPCNFLLIRRIELQVMV